MSKSKDIDTTKIARQPVSVDDLINIVPLDENTAEVTLQLIEETDLDLVKNLTKLFNLNQAKRNAVRVLKLNSLLDRVSDLMIERFQKKPGEFSNKELLDYMTVVQSTIDRANKSIALVDETPAIVINQQNNQQINVNNQPVLDRESRMSVIDAVKGIMQTLNLKTTTENIDQTDEKSDDNIVEYNENLIEEINDDENS